MADAKISQLPTGSPLAGTDLFPVAQDQGGGVFITIKTPLSALATAFSTELADDFVNVTGDTMTGDLTLTNTLDEGDTEWVHTVSDGGDYTLWANGNYNKILALNPGTASAGNTGQLITGRFRYSMPVVTQNTSATLGSGGSGVATSLVRCSNASAMNITIRANTSSVSDFDVGNFFSVLQEGVGQVTLLPETGDVVLRIPAGYIAATRDQYSVISATLFSISGATQTWVISGDLAEAP
jgi:hypothetical protein